MQNKNLPSILTYTVCTPCHAHNSCNIVPVPGAQNFEYTLRESFYRRNQFGPIGSDVCYLATSCTVQRSTLNSIERLKHWYHRSFEFMLPKDKEEILSGGTHSFELFWIQNQPLLLSRGYELRERYRPGWIPSWTRPPNAKKTKPIKKKKCPDYIISPVRSCKPSLNISLKSHSTGKCSMQSESVTE